MITLAVVAYVVGVLAMPWIIGRFDPHDDLADDPLSLAAMALLWPPVALLGVCQFVAWSLQRIALAGRRRRSAKP